MTDQPAQGSPRYRHNKRGSTYTVIGDCQVQVNGEGLTDYEIAVVYKSDADGSLWVRRKSEFHDGRFERLPDHHAEGSPAKISDDALINIATEAWSIQTDTSWSSSDGLEAAVLAVRSAIEDAYRRSPAEIVHRGRGTPARYEDPDAQSQSENMTKEEAADLFFLDAEVEARKHFPDENDEDVTRCIETALRLARRRSQPASAWQPIETAPKDGTRILLSWSHGRIACGEYSQDEYNKKPKPYWTHDQEHFIGKIASKENPPTHWMALPSADHQPTEKEI